MVTMGLAEREIEGGKEIKMKEAVGVTMEIIFRKKLLKLEEVVVIRRLRLNVNNEEPPLIYPLTTSGIVILNRSERQDKTTFIVPTN